MSDDRIVRRDAQPQFAQQREQVEDADGADAIEVHRWHKLEAVQD